MSAIEDTADELKHTSGTCLFTVFTATYNRADLLHRVYHSLRAQTLRDFEWLVVDDGSTDNTRQIVEAWREEALFPIRYVFQANAGKHSALNRGVGLARGKYFVCLDSDDGCSNDALERFAYHLDKVSRGGTGEFYGVSALCMHPNGDLYGEKFPQDEMDSDFRELFFKHRIRGEKWNCGLTEIHRQNSFPEPIRGYLPEGVVWFKIAERYKVRCVNEKLRVYYTDNPSIMRTPSYGRHSEGNRYSAMFILNENLGFLAFDIKYFLLQAVSYVRSSLHLSIPLMDQMRGLRNVRARMLWVAALPVGALVYLRDKRALKGVARR